MNPEVSDEILNAYIDNELDPAEHAALLDRAALDSSLRSRTCELWQLKQMVRGAYPLPQQKAPSARRGKSAFLHWPHALAASLLLALGSISGWFAHGRIDTDRQLVSQIDAIRAEGGRVVLHLFSDEPARMEAALRTAERLATARDNTGQPFRVEFIANGPGLHLLRTGGSPYADRIAALRHHANLRLIACQEAMERMRGLGINVTLLPGVEEAPSAESELAARLTQGWRYLQS
jgi:intracellular sulfur oxidation DsrE/DsrF family protein